MTLTKAGEWRAWPLLPIAAALGYAMSVIHIYGINPYLVPITEEFGWTRAQFTWGSTLAIGLQAVFSIPVGMAVDKYGPRLLGLIGVVALAGAFALLGTADGSMSSWLLLWTVVSLCALLTQATIWTSAVTSRFEASRGLALAVTLCGASLAQFAFPPLATALIASHGWRTAFAFHAMIWLALTLPIVFFFFRGARDGAAKSAAANPFSGAGLLQGLKSSVYLRLLLTSLLLTFAMIGLVYHFLPLLTGAGISAGRAAWIASVIGLTSIVGRLATGFLLDRLPASLVGGTVFILPAIGALVLASGAVTEASGLAAAIMIGLTVGAEVDVIVYLVTRHFGLKSFGALYGGMLAALSIGSSAGPQVAAYMFDSSGSYTSFLWMTAGLMAASSAALFSLPRAPTLDAE